MRPPPRRQMAVFDRFQRVLSVIPGNQRLVLDGTRDCGLAGLAGCQRGACGALQNSCFSKTCGKRLAPRPGPGPLQDMCSSVGVAREESERARSHETTHSTCPGPV